MGRPRTEVQVLLESLVYGEDPPIPVYFQPPSNFQMQYPCIVYEVDGANLKHAGNVLYLHAKRYQVTVIDRDPDSELPDKVIELPWCEFDRAFQADNLNHYVYTLFF